MLLWKRSFEAGDRLAPIGSGDAQAQDGIRKSCDTRDENGFPPWFSWPRPPNGFIDLGCVFTAERCVFRMLIAWLHTYLPFFDLCDGRSRHPRSGSNFPMCLLAPRHNDNAAVEMGSSYTSFYLKDTKVSASMSAQERRGHTILLPPEAIYTSKP